MSALDATLGRFPHKRPNVDRLSETRKATRFDVFFAHFTLTVYGSAMAEPLRVLRGTPIPPPGESDPVVAASQAVILILLTCVMLKRYRRLLPLLRLIRPYLLIILICVMSSFWSAFPFLTLHRSVAFGACIMFGIYCYDAFGLAGIVHIIARMSVVFAVLSIILFVAVPTIGQDPSIEGYNAMRGVFHQKNVLAMFMVLGIVCHAYRVIVDKRFTAFVLSVPVLYLSIALSQSASSLAAAAVVLAIAAPCFFAERSSPQVFYFYFINSMGVIFGAFVILFPDAIFDALGRDASLTGRLPVWSLVIDAISNQPFLGYGYAGFWNAESRDTQFIWMRVGWPVTHAHDGYLQIVLEIGIVGLLTILWAWGNTFRLAIIAKRAATLPSASWVLLLLIIVALLNVDETQLSTIDPFNALMPAAIIEIGVWNERRKQAIVKMRWAGRSPVFGTGQSALTTQSATTPASDVPPLVGLSRN